MIHRGGAFLGGVGNSGVKKGEPDTPRGGGELIKTRGKRERVSCLGAGEKNRGFKLSACHTCASSMGLDCFRSVATRGFFGDGVGRKSQSASQASITTGLLLFNWCGNGLVIGGVEVESEGFCSAEDELPLPASQVFYRIPDWLLAVLCNLCPAHRMSRSGKSTNLQVKVWERIDSTVSHL
jgi:hypothetical protein